jgi:hypothetical protein
MSPALRLRLVAIAAMAASIPALVATPWGHAGWLAIPLLVGALALADLAPITITIARQRVTFTMTEGVLAGAFLIAPGAWVVAAMCLGLVPALVRQRSSVLKAQYNLSQYFVASTLAAFAVMRLHGTIPAVVIGIVIWWMVDQVMSAVPLSIIGGESLRVMIFEDAAVYAVHAAGTASVGLLASWLLIHAPFGLLGLLVPIVLLWSAFDEQMSKSGEARLFAELARGQEQAVAHSVDTSARVVLTAAARVLGGADVELVVVEHEGPVVYAGDESGQTQRRQAPAAFDEPWVIRAMGSRGVRAGMDGDRPACSAVVGDSDKPLAVLIARRPAGSAGFGRRETGLVKVLVGQAQSWLSAAELAASRDVALARADAADQAARSLGDLGAGTAPALGMLRESATRLARLASVDVGSMQPEEDSVAGIVDELHVVERAVASLLGAIALAADPGLRDLQGDFADADLLAAVGPAPRREDDWTTTGLVRRAEPADEVVRVR